MRPAHLASDTAPSIDFILHALDTLESAGDPYDYLVLLEPTSPLTEASDVDAALQALDSARDRADAIVGVTSLVSHHPAFAVLVDAHGLIRPFAAKDFRSLPRRQDTQLSTGSRAACTSPRFRRCASSEASATTAPVIEMPRHKSFEVDDIVDFVCIEAILANRHLITGQTG